MRDATRYLARPGESIAPLSEYPVLVMPADDRPAARRHSMVKTKLIRRTPQETTLSDVLPDAERDRHYHNIGRVAVMFGACEDHAARLVFVERNGRLPEADEHITLAASSRRLRDALGKIDSQRVGELEGFADYRNRLTHSLFRYDYIETEPDEDGVRLIEGFGAHRMLHPRSGETTSIPSNDEIEEKLGEMNAWCRETWVKFRNLVTPDEISK